MTTPAGDATPGSDSLAADDRDLSADESRGDGTQADDIEDSDDGEEPDPDEPDVLSVDPDEYSNQPHMGSVPRLLGEDEYMPDTQGSDPIYAELGEEGQGDLAPEDL